MAAMTDSAPQRQVHLNEHASYDSAYSAQPVSRRSSTTVRSGSSPRTMPEPSLGCQIAPHYNREQWPYNSDSDSTDTESEIESPTQGESIDATYDIEKAETQHSRGITPALSKVNTQRSRRSRKDAVQAPVGFWHWQMVRLLLVRIHSLLTS